MTDGPTDQPASASAVLSRSRSPMTRATLLAARVSSLSASVTTVTDTVDTDPGGRIGFIRATSSGRATANPTRSPAIA